MNQQQILAIEKYFENEQESRNHYLSDEFQNIANQIDERWSNVLNYFICNNISIKAIIFAEAPLGFEKYFYSRPGNFLSGLKSYYNDLFSIKLENKDFIKFLNDRGILVFDLYQFPFPSKFYQRFHETFTDFNYIRNKLNQVSPMINIDTKFIFRYRMLINRGLQNTEPFVPFENHFIRLNGNIQSIFRTERPQMINQFLIQYL